MFPDETSEVLAKRLEFALELCALNLHLAREGVKLDYPNASPAEVDLWLKRASSFRNSATAWGSSAFGGGNGFCGVNWPVPIFLLRSRRFLNTCRRAF
jgi:hypothetical protein